MSARFEGDFALEASSGHATSYRMNSLDHFALTKLSALESSHLRRRIVDTTPLSGVFIERGGRRLISFSSNDYLNFSQHPAIKSAACDALSQFGVGSGASPLLSGSHSLYTAL